jgi:hypothetical protein
MTLERFLPWHCPILSIIVVNRHSQSQNCHVVLSPLLPKQTKIKSLVTRSKLATITIVQLSTVPTLQDHSLDERLSSNEDYLTSWKKTSRFCQYGLQAFPRTKPTMDSFQGYFLTTVNLTNCASLTSTCVDNSDLNTRSNVVGSTRSLKDTVKPSRRQSVVMRSGTQGYAKNLERHVQVFQ